jgi:hypothetical protein
MFKRPMLWLVIVVVTIGQAYCVRVLWKYVQGGAIDFAPLYGRALNAHQGITPDYSGEIWLTPPVDPKTWKPLEHPESRVDALHPPFEVIMFLPLARLPYTKAFLAWTVVNMATFWLVLVVLWKFLPGLHAKFEIAALVCGLSFPVIVCVFDGQNSLLLLLLFSLSFAALDQGRTVLSGVFLALGLFKFHLVLPILALLLVARHWRMIWGFCCGTLALLVGSFAVDGISSTLRYFPFLLRYGHQISTNGSKKNTVMPNIRGFVSVVSGPFNNVEAQLAIVAVVSVALFAAVVVWQWKFRNTSAALQFSAAIVVTSLVSYLLFPYNAVILILPFLAVASEFATGEYSMKLRRAFAILAWVTGATVIVGNFFVSVPSLCLTVECLVLLGIILVAPYDRRAFLDEVSSSPSAITVPANA